MKSFKYSLSLGLLGVALAVTPAGAQLQISEFMAENLSGIEDDQLSSSDWIEIRNNGSSNVDLEGWFLTDDANNLTKWAFPSITVKADSQIVLWASEKDLHIPLTIFQASLAIKKTHTNFKLGNNGEYLALVHPDEVTIEHEFAPGYPVQFGNVSYGVGSDGTVGYFSEPTPGEPNGLPGVVGPFIDKVTNITGEPDITTTTAVTITARVQPTAFPVAKVDLFTRFDYKSESRTSMADDGVAPDETAGDGVYTATFSLKSIFGNQVAPGGMIRWRVVATDDQGNSQRLPYFHDPADSDEYFGTVVQDPAIGTSKLPVLHRFMERPTAADSEAGTQASVYFLGEFYDNVHIDIHGQSTRGFPLKSWDLDFNVGHGFKYNENASRVKDINMLTNWADKSKVRNTMAYEMFALTGVKGHFAFPVRVQQNGEFIGTWDIVEDGDDDYLDRQGLSGGALYKMYNTLDSIGSPDPYAQNSGSEKKTRRYEDKKDLQALIDGIRKGSASEKLTYAYDNIDIPNTINFFVGNSVIDNTDYGHKNYYVYRDTEGTGEWRELPWDVDLSLGRLWTGSHNYFYDPIQTNVAAIETNNGNSLGAFIMGNSTFNEMLYRRLRTMYDELYGPPGGQPRSDYMLRRLDELVELFDPEGVASDADLEYEKYLPQMQAKEREANGWDNIDTMREAVARIRDEYIPGRRAYVYGLAKLPKAQKVSTDLKIDFTDVVYRPESGNPEEEYLVLQNTSGESVDLTGWSLAGAIDYTFRPGTVVLTGSIFAQDRGKIYVAKNINAFRARKTSPKGGEDLFVQGGYSGQLSARGETLQLLDREGVVVTEYTYEGDPSPAQEALRISEILFNPSAPAEGSPYSGKDFEFIELRNVSETPLDLAGVRFTEGVTFAFGADAELAGGAYGVLVSNRAAFESLYGTTVPVLGEFTGNLANGGERLTLQDAHGENVLSFSYKDDWAELADSSGHSLVIDPVSPVEAWDAAENWSASIAAGGSPGAADDGSGPVDPLPGTVTYATWKEGVFSAAELADANLSGPTATHHGQANLLAYAFNLNPHDQASESLPRVALDSEGYLTIRYRHHRSATDLIVTVASSSDLKTWTPLNGQAVATVPIDAATEWRTIRSDAPANAVNASALRIEVKMK